MQTVGVAKGGCRQPWLAGVQALARPLLAVPGGKAPTFGAIWLTYYPHIMVEGIRMC